MEDERRDTLRAALIRLCLELHPISGPCAVVRVDPAPSFAALANDEELRRHKITAIEVYPPVRCGTNAINSPTANSPFRT